MHVLVYAYGYSYVPMFIQTCAVVQIHTKTRTCKHTPCIHHAQRRESDLEPFWEAYQNAVKAGAIKSRDMAPDMHRWLSRNVQGLPPPDDPPLPVSPTPERAAQPPASPAAAAHAPEGSQSAQKTQTKTAGGRAEGGSPGSAPAGSGSDRTPTPCCDESAGEAASAIRMPAVVAGEALGQDGEGEGDDMRHSDTPDDMVVSSQVVEEGGAIPGSSGEQRSAEQVPEEEDLRDDEGEVAAVEEAASEEARAVAAMSGDDGSVVSAVADSGGVAGEDGDVSVVQDGDSLEEDDGLVRDGAETLESDFGNTEGVEEDGLRLDVSDDLDRLGGAVEDLREADVAQAGEPDRTAGHVDAVGEGALNEGEGDGRGAGTRELDEPHATRQSRQLHETSEAHDSSGTVAAEEAARVAEEVASRQVSRDQYRGSVERVWSASLAEDEQAFCAACERRAAVPPPAGTGEAPEGAGAVELQERSGEGGEASVQEPSSARSDTPLASLRQAATHQRQGGADTAVTSLREALSERLRLTRSLRLRPVPCVPSPRFLTQVCAALCLALRASLRMRLGVSLSLSVCVCVCTRGSVCPLLPFGMLSLAC